MTVSFESLIVIALIVVAAIFAVRFLAWLIGLLVLAAAVVFGLALASDLITGGHALQQLADKLAPAIAAVIVAFIAWVRQQGKRVGE